jgi:hypothetical protein
MITLQVVLVVKLAHAPPQPPNVDPSLPGVSVSVTGVPAAKG